MDFVEAEYHRKRQALFVVDAVRHFPGVCIENREKFFVLEWREFTLSGDTLFDAVYKLTYMIAEYPLENGGMVEISRNLLLRNGYDTPPVRKNAFHPRGLRCMTL